MSSKAPKFLPPAALQAEVLRTEKLRSSYKTAVQRAQEVIDSAHNKVTAAASRLEASKLLQESLSEDRAAVQVDVDILAHLVKSLTASQKSKEEEIERLAGELSRVEEELQAGEKDVQTCKGVEELANSSLSEAEDKYRKAHQEYEKIYARANPPPEPLSPKDNSAADGDRKSKERDARTESRKKKRSASPRRETRSRSRGRERRRMRSRSRSADHRRRKSPAPQKASAKKASKDSSKAEKHGLDKESPAGKGKPAGAGDAPSEAAGAALQIGASRKENGLPLQDTAAPDKTSEVLPNGEQKEADAARVKGSGKHEQENGHVSGDGDSSAGSSRHGRSPSGSPLRRYRRSPSSLSVSSASTGRARRRRESSRSLSGSPRRRRRRSDSPPLRRRRSGSRRRSMSRSRSRTRTRRSPREIERIDTFTMELFKSSLRKCLENHYIPFNISLINDVMRKEDRTWNIRNLNTTFLTFMKKLEDEGYVDLATRGSTTMVAGSARYRDIIEKTTERMRRARLDRRSQSRSRLRSPLSGKRRSRSPLRARRSPSRGRSRSPRRRRSPSPLRRHSKSPARGGDRWDLGGGGGERWEMT